LERHLDCYVAEYGLAESDIIFVENKHNEEWAFALDMKDNRYFESAIPRNPGLLTDEPLYKKYWESSFLKPFTSVSLPHSPEYSRIKKILSEMHSPEPSVPQGNTYNGTTSCSTYVILAPNLRVSLSSNVTKC